MPQLNVGERLKHGGHLRPGMSNVRRTSQAGETTIELASIMGRDVLASRFILGSDGRYDFWLRTGAKWC
jgi:hypothetical protein